MNSNSYLASELASIGVRFAPESKEHEVIKCIIEILTDQEHSQE